jgi:hypothetical protein
LIPCAAFSGGFSGKIAGKFGVSAAGAAGGDIIEDGFESGDTSYWSTNDSAALSVVSSAGLDMKGSYALQVITNDSTASNVYKNVTAQNNMYYRFYIRVSTLPNVNTQIWTSDADSYAYMWILPGAGVYTLRLQGLGMITTGELSLNTTYRVEIYIKKDAATGGYEFKLATGDGAASTIGTDLDQNTTAWALTQPKYGHVSGTPTSGQFYMDQIGVGSTGYLGAYP